MTRPTTLWARLKASGSLVKGLFSDPIVAEVDIDTPLGSGFLECQVRESQTGERYFVLKSRGGEATVFVPLDKAAAKQLADFIQQ